MIQEIDAKSAMLDEAISQLRARGRAYAEKERDYKVALARHMLMLRDEGIPATILSDVCKGNPEIAKLRFERDCAEVVYKSAIEAIQAIKLQIRMLDAQIAREYYSAGGVLR